MRIFKNIKKYMFAIVCSIFALSTGFVFIANSMGSNFTSATINPSDSNANINLGDILLDGYQTGSKKFDRDVVNALYEKLTGKVNATLADVKAMIDEIPESDYYAKFNNTASYVPTFDEEFKKGSPIVRSDTLRANAGGKDIVFSFGGYENQVGKRINYEWTVTSLTKAGKQYVTSGDADESKKDHVIATIWLANTNNNKVKTAQFQNFSSSSVISGYLSNIYGTSKIRVQTLNAGGYKLNSNGISPTYYSKRLDNEWAQFTMPEATGSLTDFIVTPAYINYQGTGTYKESSDSERLEVNTSYIAPNLHGNDYDSAKTNLFKSTTSTHWQDWKDDYLWLPCNTEVGSYGNFNGERSYWRLGLNQGLNGSASQAAWLRSDVAAASTQTQGRSQALAYGNNASKNSYLLANVNATYYVRPALHLDLTALEAAVGEKIPTEIETVYSGEVQDLDSLFASGVIDWYNEDVISVDAVKGNLTDAGSHTLTITLKDDYYEFDGEEHSVRTKDIAIKILPKEVNINTLNIDKYGRLMEGKEIEIIESIAKRDIGTDRAPIFALQYRSASSSIWTTNIPSTPGNYFARAYITNPNTSNYTLKDPGETSFSRPKDPTTTPWFAFDGMDGDAVTSITTGWLTTVKYNGQQQSFKLTNNASGSGLSGIIVGKRSAGLSYNQATGEFLAKEVGTYTVVVSLSDGGANHQWDDSLGAGTTRTVTLKIVETELNVTIVNADDFKENFAIGTVENAVLSVTGICNEEAVKLNVYYKKVSDGIIIDRAEPGDIVQVGNEITITLSLEKLVDPDAQYALCVELATDSSAPSTNKNYVISSTDSEIDFFVVTATISSVDLNWQYENELLGINAIGLDTTGNYSATVVYNGKAFVVGFDKTTLPRGLVVDYKITYTDISGNIKPETQCLNADTYTITATLSTLRGYELDSSIQTVHIATLYLQSAYIDVNDIVYTANPVYTGRPQQIKPLDLPDAISYASSSSGGYTDKEYESCGDGEHYTAKFTYTVKAENGRYNYSFSSDLNNPVYSIDVEHEWRIEKDKIVLSNDPSLWDEHVHPFNNDEYRIPFPIVQNTYSRQLLVKYYSDAACTQEIDVHAPHTTEEFEATDEDGNPLYTGNGIRVDLGTPYTYYAKVTIHPDFANNYALYNPLTGGNEVVYEFTVGDKRVVLDLDLGLDKENFYNGQFQGINPVDPKDLVTEFKIRYFKDDGSGSYAEELVDAEGNPIEPKEVGKYKATIELTETDSIDYVVRNKVFYFEIKPLVVFVDKWNGASVSDAPYADLVDENGNKIADGLVNRKIYTDPFDPANPDDSLVDYPNEALVPGKDYWVVLETVDGNVQFASGATTQIKFTAIDPNGPKELVDDPSFVFDKLEWTGSQITFQLKDWEKWKDYIDIAEGEIYLTQTDIGVYTVTLSINVGKHAEWATSITGEDGNEVLTRTLTFEIIKGRIEGEWKNDKGYPEFVLSDPNDADKFEIKYFDSEGNEVLPENFVKGQNYRAELILKDKNFEFISEDPNFTPIQEFNYQPPENFFAKAWKFIKANWLWFVIGLSVLLFLLLLWLIIFLIKRRKEKEEIVEEEKKEEAKTEEPKQEENTEVKTEKVEEKPVEKPREENNVNGATNIYFGGMPQQNQQPQYQQYPPQQQTPPQPMGYGYNNWIPNGVQNAGPNDVEKYMMMLEMAYNQQRQRMLEEFNMIQALQGRLGEFSQNAAHKKEKNIISEYEEEMRKLEEIREKRKQLELSRDKQKLEELKDKRKILEVNQEIIKRKIAKKLEDKKDK